MQIIVNGGPTEVPEDITLAGLVEQLGLAGQRIAVEVNEEFVPRGSFGEHRLAPDDRIEVIHAVGGG
jgi:sulfur carrier protein